jgi:hypothetical protein
MLRGPEAESEDWVVAGSWVPAGLANKEAFRLKEEKEPEYRCNVCNELAPTEVVDAKLDAMQENRGIDPRNNRRAAIQAAKAERSK